MEKFDLSTAELGLEDKSFTEILGIGQGLFSGIPGLNTLEEFVFPNKFKGDIDYVNKRLVTVPIPTGLKVTYLEYFKLMESAVFITASMYDRVLVPLARWLSISINSPDTLASARVKDISDFKPANIKDINKTLIKFFEKKPNTTNKKLGEVVKRKQEIPEINGIIESMELHTARVDNKKILDKISEINYLFETLIGVIGEKEIKESKRTKLLLVELLTVSTNETTFLSNILFNQKVLLTAYKGTLETIYA